MANVVEVEKRRGLCTSLEGAGRAIREMTATRTIGAATGVGCRVARLAGPQLGGVILELSWGWRSPK